MQTIQTTKQLLLLGVCLLLVGNTRVTAQPDSPVTPGAPLVVGRVYEIEGDLLRYVPETKDWVAVVRDAPFAAEGTFYSGTSGRAELIVPNQTWVRVGNSTQIQFIGLASDLTEVDVASGEARFGNKSAQAVIKATSDIGYVLANAGTVFDFCVGDNSVEVVPIRGTVTFVHAATNARYDVAAGSPSLLADAQQVSSGEGAVDADWDRWNATREAFWTEKAQSGLRSAKYLPPTLHDESYVLDENGQWDTVDYEGQKRVFWRPMHVAADWAPFTAGRWTDWDGDQTWIPAEPFGYMTHHYGNWVYAGRSWYWAPPVASVHVGLPLLDIGFNWNPGRVSWIHSDSNVGWVPLAPQETYYSHRQWGERHGKVIRDANISLAVNIGRLAFLGQAIVVNQRHFSDVRDYRRVRETHINRTTIINNYHAAPVVNNTVINNYTVNNNRYNYTNVTVGEKPHASVLARIDRNEKTIRGGKHVDAAAVQTQVRAIPAGRINRDARIAAPIVTNRIVPASEVNRPQSEVKFTQRELKAKVDRQKQPVPTVRDTKKMEPLRVDRQKQPVPAVRDTKKMEPPKVNRQKQPVPAGRDTKKMEPPKVDRQKQPVPAVRDTKKVDRPKQPVPAGRDTKKMEPPKVNRQKQPVPAVRDTKKVDRPKQPVPAVRDTQKMEPPKVNRQKQPVPAVRDTQKMEPPKVNRQKQPVPAVRDTKKVDRPKQPVPAGRDTKKMEPPKVDRQKQPVPAVRDTKKVDRPKQPVPAVRDTQKMEQPKVNRQKQPVPAVRDTKKMEPPKVDRQKQPVPPADGKNPDKAAKPDKKN